MNGDWFGTFLMNWAYTAGFNTLSQLLAMFTLFTAAAVFLFPGRQGEVDVGVESTPRYRPSLIGYLEKFTARIFFQIHLHRLLAALFPILLHQGLA